MRIDFGSRVAEWIVNSTNSLVIALAVHPHHEAIRECRPPASGWEAAVPGDCTRHKSESIKSSQGAHSDIDVFTGPAIIRRFPVVAGRTAWVIAIRAATAAPTRP